MPGQFWTLLGSRPVYDHFIFTLQEDHYRLEPEAAERHFMRLDCPDWINVIPLTPDRQVVLIRQYRHGVREVTLEIPGGMVDAGEPPDVAAARELLEETGYVGERLVRLGDVQPNPAFLSNVCHFFLAEKARLVAAAAPDPFEKIEVVTVPLDDIPRLVRTGQIRHGLVLNAFAMLGVHLGVLSDTAGPSGPLAQG